MDLFLSVQVDVYLKKYGLESLYQEAINDAINVAYKELLDNNKLKIK